MLIWAIAALGLVLGIKYYTSLQMRNLEKRLNVVKDSLKKAKEMHSEAQTRQRETSEEEQHHEERIRSMKEILQDIQMRLTSSDRSEEKDMVGG